MSEDPVKRLAWLRADCDAVRALLAQMPAEWFQERAELAIRIEEHEREIAAIERDEEERREAAESRRYAIARERMDEEEHERTAAALAAQVAP